MVCACGACTTGASDLQGVTWRCACGFVLAILAICSGELAILFFWALAMCWRFLAMALAMRWRCAGDALAMRWRCWRWLFAPLCAFSFCCRVAPRRQLGRPEPGAHSTQGSLPDAPVAAFGALRCAFKHSKVTQYARAMCIKTLTNLKVHGSRLCRIGNWHR